MRIGKGAVDFGRKASMGPEGATKRALALAGGGFTGYLFEIGALTALDDLFDGSFTVNDFDLYVGVSAGSAAASLIANGVKPQEILETNLSSTRPYYFDHRDIFAPAFGEGLKTVPRAIRQLIPLLKLYVRHYPEMTLIDLLDKAQDVLPSGIYTLKPFARYLERTFRAKGLSDTFAELRRELYIPAIDLETGDCVIFGDEGWRELPISRAVTASSAVPIYFCPVRIDGRDYIDAGIGRLAFFDLAVAKRVGFMVVINPMVRVHLPRSTRDAPAHPSYQACLRDRGFLAIGEQASRINFDVRFSQALELFERSHPDKELLVMTPTPHDALLFERSFLTYHDRVLLLRAGYVSVVTLVRERGDELEAQFARHGIGLSLARFDDLAKQRMARLDRSEASFGLPQHPVRVNPVGVEPAGAGLCKADQRPGNG
jgi:predicted acylesterase/phospholipase RssA